VATDTSYIYEPAKAISDLTANRTEFCLDGTNFHRIKLILTP